MASRFAERGARDHSYVVRYRLAEHATVRDKFVAMHPQVASEHRAQGHDGNIFANAVRERLAHQQRDQITSTELLAHPGMEEYSFFACARYDDEVGRAD